METQYFYVETQIGKNHEEKKEENSLSLTSLQELYLCLGDNKWRHDIFTWKLESGKITGRRRRKICYNSPVYRNYIYVLVFVWVRIGRKAKKSPLLAGEECLFVLNSYFSGGWGVDKIRVTTQSSCEDLFLRPRLQAWWLRLHARNFIITHNYPPWTHERYTFSMWEKRDDVIAGGDLDNYYWRLPGEVGDVEL